MCICTGASIYYAQLQLCYTYKHNQVLFFSIILYFGIIIIATRCLVLLIGASFHRVGISILIFH